MVFDISEMKALRERYKDELSFRVPTVVFLDRYDGYKQERELIEELSRSLPPEKLKNWIGNFINTDRRQHIGAWFEIMLYGWLKPHFKVQVEPDINGKHPDFLIDIEDNQVLIESIAYLYSPEELIERAISSEFIYLLETIEKPFAIDIEPIKYGKTINKKDFLKRANLWLDLSFDYPFRYEDKFGNILDLKVAYKIKNKKIGVMVNGDVRLVDTDQVKKPLHRKIQQHHALKENNSPYIIAIYLESWQYNADEVITAWFGRNQTVFDKNSGIIIREQNDLSGLAFHGRSIRNRGISGILVFKRTEYPYDGNEILNSWYIQNPYARHKVNPESFPVDGRFVIVSSENKKHAMDWIGLRP